MADRAPLSILIVTQYFWPENMRINDLVEGMTVKGHQVTVLTGLPNYPEGSAFPDYQENPKAFSDYKGAAVVRVPMFVRGKRTITLALNYLSFFVSASVVGNFKLRHKQFDVIFVYAVSPVMAAIPAIILGRLKKTPVFVWILDLWPDSLRAVGVIKNRIMLDLIGRCVSWIYDRTDYLLVQSRAFAENVRQYCRRPIDDSRILYFPSWAEDVFLTTNQSASLAVHGEVKRGSYPMEPKAPLTGGGEAPTAKSEFFTTMKMAESDLLAKDTSVFTIVFAGNIGEAQDFPSILVAAEQLRTLNIPVRWVVVGDGRAGSWLTRNIAERGLDNVHFLGRHPLEKMPALFAVADALLVSLKTNDVFARTIPGKIQTYLASGRPVIAMLDGEGARIIKESQSGKTCSPGDSMGLANIIQEMVTTPKENRENMGMLGRHYYHKNFSRKSLFTVLENLFYTATPRRNSHNQH